jgi:hypothetical protein
MKIENNEQKIWHVSHIASRYVNITLFPFFTIITKFMKMIQMAYSFLNNNYF